MLFWHLGATMWLFRWIFRDPKVDVRFLLLGAILPDLIDLPLGTLFGSDRFATGDGHRRRQSAHRCNPPA